jgi:hypothetical protein
MKIHSILVTKLIPELHKFLAKKEDESLVVRTPVALAITKLLQRMPHETLQTNLPKLVLTLCNILKSRQQSARNTYWSRCWRVLELNTSGTLSRGFMWFLLRVISSVFLDMRFIRCLSVFQDSWIHVFHVFQDLMVFIHVLVNEYLDLSKVKDGVSCKGSKGHSMLESNFSIQMKRPDQAHRPLKHFQANAHRFVEFGYSLLLTAYKRSTLDVNDEAFFRIYSWLTPNSIIKHFDRNDRVQRRMPTITSGLSSIVDNKGNILFNPPIVSSLTVEDILCFKSKY